MKEVLWLSVVPAGVVVVRRVFGFAARYNTCISAQTATAENTAEGWCVTVHSLTVVNTSLQKSIKDNRLSDIKSSSSVLQA